MAAPGKDLDKLCPPWGFGLTYWLLAGSMVGYATILVHFGWNETGVRELVQWSGRFSFALFSIAFAASGIHVFFKSSWSWWIRMNRKYFGISFAIVHFIHLIWIFLLQMDFHPVFQQAALSSLVGGFIAYSFVLLMLITSFDRTASLLSRRSWSFLHTAGGYWIFAIFLSTYWKRVDTEPIYWTAIVILTLVLCFRIAKTFQKN